LIPEISVDAEINFEDINPKLIRVLSQFEPFGPENMTPVFLTKNIKDTGYAKPIGQNDEHLKLFVKQNNSEGFGAIGFGLGNKFSLEENEWKDTVTLQLQLRDIR
jgi:single-stranded-DNA-specific exonuclease